MMQRKSEISEAFKKFRALAERQCGRKILVSQTDNATKFVGLTSCLNEIGIKHRHSCPYSHQQMGYVERRY